MRKTEFRILKCYEKTDLISYMYKAGLALLLLAAPLKASAFDMVFNLGAHHLPASTYHYAGYSLHLDFNEKSNRINRVDLGMNFPYSSGGYSQLVMFTSFNWIWFTSSKGSTIRPFGGLGPGIYLDKVNNEKGFVPSVVFRGGVRVGGKFGFQGELTNYMGIYSLSQLTDWVVWPMIIFSGGFYAEF